VNVWPDELLRSTSVVLGLMQQCRYGRHHLPDPVGNFIDVAE
jgi:hypothetical protein